MVSAQQPPWRELLFASCDKHYFSSAKAPEGMKAPLTVQQMMPEGGTLAYLIRLHGHQILALGGNNYIEGEIEGLEPDVVLVDAGPNQSRYKALELLPALRRTTQACSRWR